jgi:hypothetical protein
LRDCRPRLSGHAQWTFNVKSHHSRSISAIHLSCVLSSVKARFWAQYPRGSALLVTFPSYRLVVRLHHTAIPRLTVHPRIRVGALSLAAFPQTAIDRDVSPRQRSLFSGGDGKR